MVSFLALMGACVSRSPGGGAWKRLEWFAPCPRLCGKVCSSWRRVGADRREFSILSPRLTGRSRETKRSWTSLSSARSLSRFGATDDGVGNGDSRGSDFRTGEPCELLSSAGKRDMTSGSEALESGRVRRIVRNVRVLTTEFRRYSSSRGVRTWQLL